MSYSIVGCISGNNFYVRTEYKSTSNYYNIVSFLIVKYKETEKFDSLPIILKNDNSLLLTRLGDVMWKVIHKDSLEKNILKDRDNNMCIFMNDEQVGRSI